MRRRSLLFQFHWRARVHRRHCWILSPRHTPIWTLRSMFEMVSSSPFLPYVRVGEFLYGVLCRLQGQLAHPATACGVPARPTYGLGLLLLRRSLPSRLRHWSGAILSRPSDVDYVLQRLGHFAFVVSVHRACWGCECNGTEACCTADPESPWLL